MRADKWTRLACGLGLVLLVAAQEKVWPWLVEVPEAAQQDARSQSTPASPTDEGNDSEKKAKPPLPHVVPDAPVPRWPAGWSEATARQSPGLRDGVVSCGPRESGSQHSAPADTAPPERGWLCLIGPVPIAALDARPEERVADPALVSCIRQTGPPRA